MIALLAILGMTVSAERSQETGNAETIGSLSGGDAAGEQIMPYADGVIASDTDNNDNIDWKIDASGRLTVTGTEIWREIFQVVLMHGNHGAARSLPQLSM